MPFITLSDGQPLHVRVIGQGQPVVLLHGFASQAAHWLPNVLPLRHKFRFILPDLRGFGKSSKTLVTADNIFEQYAHDLHEVLEHFQLDQVILGGISTGAYTCLTYNKLYGFERVCKYLNIEHSPEALNHGDWQHGLFDGKQDEFFAVFTRLSLLADEAGADTPYQQLPKEVRHAFADTLARVLANATNTSLLRLLVRAGGRYAEPLLAGTLFPVDNWYAYIQAMRSFMNGNDTRDYLHQIKVPTTLMIGGQSRYFSTDGQLEIKRHAPQAEVVIFDKSGHIPMLDQPVCFQREFMRFFNG